MARLLVLPGPDKGKAYVARLEPVAIGRSDDTDIRLTDNTVSRRDAEVRPENAGLVIEDLNSSNGTYVNGQRIYKSVRLKHGDQIKVGATLLVYPGEDAGRLRTGTPMPHDRLEPDRGAWIQVAKGAITLNQTRLDSGDGAAASGEEQLQLTALAESEVLVFDLL